MIDALLITAIIAACFLVWMEITSRKEAELYKTAAVLLHHRGRAKIVTIDDREYSLVLIPLRRRGATTIGGGGINWDHELQKLKDKGDQ